MFLLMRRLAQLLPRPLRNPSQCRPLLLRSLDPVPLPLNSAPALVSSLALAPDLALRRSLLDLPVDRTRTPSLVLSRAQRLALDPSLEMTMSPALSGDLEMLQCLEFSPGQNRTLGRTSYDLNHFQY